MADIQVSTDKGIQTFSNADNFALGQRVATMLTQSTMIPENFRNNLPNTMIALEMASRIGASPLMVMQNLYIIHGKPSWSATFIISAINACGRFTPLRYVLSGKGEDLECYAWAKDKTGETLKGTTVTMKMAVAEGWVSKSGSKWKTMPELMIQYRAATFFGRMYCPDILMGMHTAEEVEDFTDTITWEQRERIERLLETSTYSPEKRKDVMWQIKYDISQGDAFKIISEIRENQIQAIDMPNPSVTDAKEEVLKLINQD